MALQRVPALRVFWDLEKTVLHETRVSWTVLWSPTNANSPTYTYISQKMCCGNRVSYFRVSGGPPVDSLVPCATSDFGFPLLFFSYDKTAEIRRCQ